MIKLEQSAAIWVADKISPQSYIHPQINNAKCLQLIIYPLYDILYSKAFPMYYMVVL